MWTAALALVQPVWSFVKPFWKYLVAAAALIALCWFIHNWYEGKLDAAFNRGVAVTEAKDAAVLAERKKLNDQIINELRISAAAKQAELEGKLHANEIIATDLRTQLRTRRVCSDERSGRSVSGDSGTARKVNGATGDAGPAKSAQEDTHTTVGDDLVAIGEACQSSTDKLIALQGYVNDLMGQLRRATESAPAR